MVRVAVREVVLRCAARAILGVRVRLAVLRAARLGLVVFVIAALVTIVRVPTIWVP